METLSREDLEYTLYDRGGWELELLKETNDKMVFGLQLPFNIGSIYFERVEEYSSYNMTTNQRTNVWKFCMLKDGVRIVSSSLESNALPRDLKSPILTIDNYVKHRPRDKSLKEWLEE